ncbi:hypothetical protein ACFSX5_10610 [Devosia albogilva]|uniref:Uncharacterized protein n=1 Tax=Devosia albogilva TaxID=429726 RepID=A0ABW5QKG8_9HYPH
MFVRYATDEIEPPNRKVFETLSDARADFSKVRRMVGRGEFEIALLFHLPTVSDVRTAARAIDDRLSGKPPEVEIVVLDLEQSSSRRMRDLAKSLFADFDF